MSNIGHIALEAFRGIIVFSLPWFIGQIIKSKSISFTYLCGQLLLWAVFQLFAVPMVFCRAGFSTLFWVYTGIVFGLTVPGVYTLMKGCGRVKKRKSKVWWKRVSPFLIIAFLIIGYQMFTYIFGMHLDEDDARWIAEANDALAKNKMLLHNPATGEYIGQFAGEMVKDVFSPWSMYLAVLSRWTGIRAVVIAHTIYPPILLGLSCSAYYEIGSQLFKRKHERGIFLLMASLVNLFMAGNVYTQSVFTLTRIWQGKAVVASVMIPALLMMMIRVQPEDKFEGQSTLKKGRALYREKRNRFVKQEPIKKGMDTAKSVSEWLLLMIAGAASCLFSGVGIAISLIMISVYGLYIVIRIVIEERKKGLISIPLWLLSIAPSLAFCLGFLVMKQ